jgi:hypothetical protein
MPGADQRQGQQLDGLVQRRIAQDVDLENALHELRQGAFQHHQKGHAEQAGGHDDAELEMFGAQHRLLGDQESRKDQQEKPVVAIAVLLAVARQRPHQHDDDGREEQHVG